MIVSFVIAGVIANPNAVSASQSAEETAQAGMALFVVSIINALLLAYPISRSRWHGLKLVGAVLLVFFGIQTFMSQIETIFFGSAFNISATEMTSIVLTDFLTAVFFSFLAVLIMGKMRKPKEQDAPTAPFVMSAKDWAMRLVLLPLALVDRTPEIHHSDQGVQYAATAYVEVLKAHQIAISMAEVGEAWQNGYAERLVRTIKEEEVDLSGYRDYQDAYGQLGRFLDDVYMRKRIHSSLGYLTPVEFESRWLAQQTAAALVVAAEVVQF